MPELVQIAIRATREYNKIVEEVCDLLEVNRPLLFREALVFYLVNAQFSHKNGAFVDDSVKSDLADRLIEEGEKIKTYSRYTKSNPHSPNS